MCKLESSEVKECRAQLTDSWKPYSKARAFKCLSEGLLYFKMVM